MKCVCEICGKEFSQWRKDRVPRFCSILCKIKSKDKYITCPQCGLSFRVSQEKNRKFCSSSCANKYNRKPDADKHEEIICKNCGIPFSDYKYRKTVFCSNICKSKYGARQPKPKQKRPENFITKKCCVCEKEFTTHKSQSEQGRTALYCSVVCKLRSKVSAPELQCKKILEEIGINAEHQVEIKSNLFIDFRIGNIILQVDGEYWHGHPRFEPLTERQIAQRKRDYAQDKYLIACGYIVVRIWESQITKENIIKLLSG